MQLLSWVNILWYFIHKRRERLGQGVSCSLITYLWVWMCVQGECVCVYGWERKRKRGWVWWVGFITCGGEGVGSFLPFLPQMNQDERKRKLFVAFAKDFHLDGAQKAQCVNYKVVQIWPGQTVTCLHTNRPGHIWTTLYIAVCFEHSNCALPETPLADWITVVLLIQGVLVSIPSRLFFSCL